MRIVFAVAIAATMTLDFGDCFGHHQKAVVVEPVHTPPFK